MIITLTFTGFTIYRTPDYFGCLYEAKIDQSVESGGWRFNWVANKCQFFNGDRWIKLDKVIDVGSGDVDALE